MEYRPEFFNNSFVLSKRINGVLKHETKSIIHKLIDNTLNKMSIKIDKNVLFYDTNVFYIFESIRKEIESCSEFEIDTIKIDEYFENHSLDYLKNSLNMYVNLNDKKIYK